MQSLRLPSNSFRVLYMAFTNNANMHNLVKQENEQVATIKPGETLDHADLQTKRSRKATKACVKKPGCFRPELVPINQMRKYQLMTKYMIPKHAIQRFVKQIVQELKPNDSFRMQSAAVFITLLDGYYLLSKNDVRIVVIFHLIHKFFEQVLIKLQTLVQQIQLFRHIFLCHQFIHFLYLFVAFVVDSIHPFLCRNPLLLFNGFSHNKQLLYPFSVFTDCHIYGGFSELSFGGKLLFIWNKIDAKL
ncbi:unnamed protein product [Medioppia subpectinata]|uniref:Uncharacterized protein n=1 Tax=Medioppia subpectinata TaxID=1979941 RepID=A0A7R9KJB8_9ACAR|nr:unnamed protein product [Medioppia subpectinata]CAG2104756.1 unnamed protein product [Medioppia subpectinata]